MLAWYLSLLMDKAMGVSEKEEVQRKRGAELRDLLIQSKSVSLIVNQKWASSISTSGSSARAEHTVLFWIESGDDVC